MQPDCRAAQAAESGLTLEVAAVSAQNRGLQLGCALQPEGDPHPAVSRFYNNTQGPLAGVRPGLLGETDSPATLLLPKVTAWPSGASDTVLGLCSSLRLPVRKLS